MAWVTSEHTGHSGMISVGFFFVPISLECLFGGTVRPKKLSLRPLESQFGPKNFFFFPIFLECLFWGTLWAPLGTFFSSSNGLS